MATITVKSEQYQLACNHLRFARKTYNRAKKFLAQANRGKGTSKSIAMAYLNHARANLRVAINNANSVLNRG